MRSYVLAVINPHSKEIHHQISDRVKCSIDQPGYQTYDYPVLALRFLQILSYNIYVLLAMLFPTSITGVKFN